jgi:hypothetical protein
MATTPILKLVKTLASAIVLGFAVFLSKMTGNFAFLQYCLKEDRSRRRREETESASLFHKFIFRNFLSNKLGCF